MRSNVIAPGPIAGTEGMTRLKPTTPDGDGDAASLFQTAPVGRWGDVRDVANATVFLFSDAAAFVTGQVLAVDGGHEHLRTTQLPYPRSVLDPAGVKHMITPRL